MYADVLAHWYISGGRISSVRRVFVFSEKINTIIKKTVTFILDGTNTVKIFIKINTKL